MAPSSKSKKRKPKKGAIYSIKLKNFMTYSEAEFRPGQSFNVILGPNGSGKSSIVTAMNTAFAGDLKELRRQKSMQDLVKEGQDEAQVTIKVYTGELDDNGRSVKDTVVCTIRKKNKEAIVTYSKNGKKASKKEILQLAADYQIQTSNMCQFLPQEKVAEFAKMKPLDRFQSTLRAIGNLKMLEIHDGLSKKQCTMNNLEDSKKTKENTLHGIEEDLKQLQYVKDLMQKRKVLEDDIDLHEKCYLYYDCKDLEKKLKRNHDKQKEEKGKKEKIEKTKSELKGRIDNIQKQDKSLKTTNQALKAKVSEIELRMAKSPVQDLEETIKRKSDEIKSAKTKASNRKQMLKEMKNGLVAKKSQLNSYQEEETIKELEMEDAKKNNLEVSMDGYTNEIREKDSKIGIYIREIDKLKAQIKHRSSEEEKRLSSLQKQNEDAYRGVKWLRENINQFRNPKGIYEPIMMTMRLQDSQYAVQLEHIIGNQQLEAFVCEDVKDCNDLMNKLRKDLKLKKINVIHCEANANEQFHNPTNVIPRDCKAVFLDKVFKCPSTIKNYLCIKKKLKDIPVLDRLPSQENFNCPKFFVGLEKHETFGSSYHSVKTTSVRDLSTQEPKYLLESPQDQEDVADLQKDIENYNENLRKVQLEKDRLSASLKDKRTKHADLLLKITNLTTAIETIDMAKNEIRKLENDIKGLENLSNDKESIQRLINERLEKTKKLTEANAQLQKDVRESYQNTVDIQRNQLRIDQLTYKNQDDLNEFNQAKVEIEIIEKNETKLKAEMKSMLANLESNSKKGAGWLDAKKPPIKIIDEVLEAAMNDRCPKPLPEIKAKKDSLHKELDRIPEVTKHQQDQIKAKEQQFEKQKSEVERLEREVNNLKFELRQDEGDLVRGIQDMVENINENFSSKMKSIGYAGQVILKQGEGELDFKNYGLDIMVKFRDNESLTALTNHTQSGGEKSVTTALYIMSLQELTQVPFRCVDEINQGMDEYNEKRVWELLVDTANQHAAQFFYLAPKFPTGLEFDKNINVHICLNGDVDAETHLDVDNVISRMQSSAKKRRRSSNEASTEAEAD